MRPAPIRLIAASLILCALAVPADATPTPAQRCEADVELASAKYAQCRLTAEARFAKDGDAARRDGVLVRCSEKLHRALDTATGRYGLNCTQEQASGFDAFLAQCLDQVVVAAGTGGTLPAPSPELLVARDSNDAVIGETPVFVPDDAQHPWLIPATPVIVSYTTFGPIVAWVTPEGFEASDAHPADIWFQESDCSGLPFIEYSGWPQPVHEIRYAKVIGPVVSGVSGLEGPPTIVAGDTTTAYYAALGPAETKTLVALLKSIPVAECIAWGGQVLPTGACCRPTSQPLNYPVWPAQSVDLSGFVPPIRIEARDANVVY